MFRNKIKYFFIFIILIVANYFIYTTIDIDFNIYPRLIFDVKGEMNDMFQIFYIAGGDDNWSEEHSTCCVYDNAAQIKKMDIVLPKDVRTVRIDPGEGLSDFYITDMKIKYGFSYRSFFDGNDRFTPLHSISVFDIDNENRILHISPSGSDPFFSADISGIYDKSNDISEYLNIAARIACCVLSSVFIVLIGTRIGFVYRFLKGLFDDRKLIFRFAANDFKTKYVGSFLGTVWAFIQPVVTVIVYWFVFQVGLKATDVGDCPFVLWLVSGIVPWFFFSDALMGGTSSLLEYSYLVKKVVFKISVIPIVKIISAFFVHCFFICFTFAIFLCYGYRISWYMLQIIYYTFALFVFTLGIVYITSAIVLFFKDLSQIINIILQIGVWFTPIMWSYTMVGPEFRIFFKLNPLFYVVQGYRDSLIDHYWIWQRTNYTIYFWLISIGIFGLGTLAFRKLKVHFADVL